MSSIIKIVIGVILFCIVGSCALRSCYAPVPVAQPIVGGYGYNQAPATVYTQTPVYHNNGGGILSHVGAGALGYALGKHSNTAPAVSGPAYIPSAATKAVPSASQTVKAADPATAASKFGRAPRTFRASDYGVSAPSAPARPSYNLTKPSTPSRSSYTPSRTSFSRRK